MDKTFKSDQNSEKGFTLIELLIVIAIIAILAAIAIPQFMEYRARGIESQMTSDVKNFGTAMYAVYYDCGDFSGTLTNPSGPLSIVTGTGGECVVDNASQSLKVTLGNTLSWDGNPTATTYELCVTNPGATRTNRNFVASNESGGLGWGVDCASAVLAIR